MFEVWGLMFDVYCLMFDVWCLLFGVRCLLFGVWGLVFEVLGLMFVYLPLAKMVKFAMWLTKNFNCEVNFVKWLLLPLGDCFNLGLCHYQIASIVTITSTICITISKLRRYWPLPRPLPDCFDCDHHHYHYQIASIVNITITITRLLRLWPLP